MDLLDSISGAEKQIHEFPKQFQDCHKFFFLKLVLITLPVQFSTFHSESKKPLLLLFLLDVGKELFLVNKGIVKNLLGC